MLCAAGESDEMHSCDCQVIVNNVKGRTSVVYLIDIKMIIIYLLKR